MDWGQLLQALVGSYLKPTVANFFMWLLGRFVGAGLYGH